MLPHTFEYLKPTSLGETLDVLDQLKDRRVHVLAGGTDLLPFLRAGLKEADCLVDLSGSSLNQVIFEKDRARIGAMVTFTALGWHPEIARRLPAVSEAARQVGAVQCRNRATIGGNLCSAVPSLDGAPPLLTLGAKFRLQTKGKERLVPAEQFFLGPRLTVLQPGEILTEIIVSLEDDFSASFLSFGRRKALTLAIVNTAAGISLRDRQEITVARITLGAVAPTPIRAYKAERVLEGEKLTPGLLAEAAEVAAGETSPISDLRASADYRRRLSAVLVRRALESSLGRAAARVSR